MSSGPRRSGLAAWGNAGVTAAAPGRTQGPAGRASREVFCEQGWVSAGTAGNCGGSRKARHCSGIGKTAGSTGKSPPPRRRAMDGAAPQRYPARPSCNAPVAQLDRALPSGGRGQGFESLRARQLLQRVPSSALSDLPALLVEIGDPRTTDFHCPGDRRTHLRAQLQSCRNCKPIQCW